MYHKLYGLLIISILLVTSTALIPFDSMQYLKDNNDSPQKITSTRKSSIIQNISDRDAYLDIKNQLKNGSIALEDAIQDVIHNFAQLIQTVYGRKLLCCIARNTPRDHEDHICALWQTSSKYITELCTHYTGYRLLCILGVLLIKIKRYTLLYEELKYNFLKIQNTQYGSTLIYKFLLINNSLTALLCTNYKSLCYPLRYCFNQYKHFLSVEEQNCINHTIVQPPHTLMEALLYKEFFSDDIYNHIRQSYAQTPTEKHLQINLAAVPWKFKTSPRLQSMINHVIQKELELRDTHYTFLHGQRWEYEMTERWFTWLWQIKNHQTLDDYWFLHVKEIPIALEEQKQLRHSLLKYGRNSSDNIEGRKHVLSLNYAFFGNSSVLGSSTARYIVKNKNVGPTYANIRTAFECLGYGAIFEQFSEELYALAKSHKKLSRYGNLALIAIPKEKVVDCVYLSSTGTYKRSPVTIRYPDETIIQTDEIPLILKTLTEHPEYLEDSDGLEFGLIMTADAHGALNPFSGIKVFMINAARSDLYQAFREREQKLFEKIKHAIDAL